MPEYREWTTTIERRMTDEEAERVAGKVGGEMLVKKEDDRYEIMGLSIDDLAELVSIDIIDPMLMPAANDTVLFEMGADIDTARAKSIAEWTEEHGEPFMRRAQVEDVKTHAGNVQGVWLTARGLHKAALIAAHWEARANAKGGSP